MRYLVPALLSLCCANFAPAQEWGTIKGQIVWKGNAMPERKAIDVVKLPDCRLQNPPLQDNIMVDPKTKGVKDVLIWLAPDGNAPLPIHPNLKQVPNKEVVIDQPCCLFEPRVVAMRQGQILVVKNSAGFSHSVHISPPIGSTKNAESNTTISTKGEKRFDKDKLLKADLLPIKLTCDTHGHMAGRIGVFEHPYFAITGADGTFEIKDAPSGRVRILIQHDSGWLHTPRESDKEKKLGGRYGQPIAIPAAESLDLGKIEMKPEYLKN